MKKLMAPYRKELASEFENDLKQELKSNYKDYLALKEASSSTETIDEDTQVIEPLEQPVFMSLQVVDTCKSKW